MEYRELGRTGLKVSLIGLGTMTWGNQNTEAEGHEQMDYAITKGINFFDTAEMYAIPPSPETQGKTEEIIGTWFKTRKNREKIILASKIVGPGLRWIRDGAGIDGKNIRLAVEGSLKRLQTDYIDLYQLHWPNRPNYHWSKQWTFDTEGTKAAQEIESLLDILQALGDLVKAGKIRHIGLSNDSSWGVMQYLRLSEIHGLPRLVSIQNEYSLLCRVFEPDLAEVSLYENVGLLAWSPLAGGIISGKYLDGKRPPGSRWSLEKRAFFRDTEQSRAAIRAYIDVAKKHGLDVCQMALAFVNSKPFVASTLIGATTMEQLKTDIASIDVKLSPEVFSDIETVRRQYPMPY